MPNTDPRRLDALLPSSSKAARKNLLDGDIATNLTVAEQKALSTQILGEQIRLDKAAKDADQRFHDSTRDMARDVQMIRGLDGATRGDFDVDSRYQTASGETSVSVRRNTNTSAMVVAVVVGIIVLFLLNR